MFLGRGARLSGRVFHNGKGRPHTSTVFNKNVSKLSPSQITFLSNRVKLSYHTPRSFAPLRQHSTPIRPLSRSWQSPRILSHQSLRFASNTPIVPAAQLTETSTQTSVTGATDSAASSADAWADTLKDFPSVDYAKLEPHFGYLKEMGLDFGWGPTAFVEWMLEHVHVISGLPWAGSIAITALIVRFGLLKLFINASDTSARMATIQPLLQPIQEEIKVAKARQDSQTMVDAASRLRGVYRSANISFAALFLPMVAQGALGVGSFRLLRNMAELPVPGFDQGGFLWLTDLTYPDPLYLLPAITTGIVFWTMKVTFPT